MIQALPLNLLFYFCFTILGLWLMTRNDKQAKYICKILACALFVFMAIWVSNDVLFDLTMYYVNHFNVTTGNYTYAIETVHTTTGILPVTLLVLLSVSLAIISAIYLYVNTEKGKR